MSAHAPHGGDVPRIGAAAPADHSQTREQVSQGIQRGSELDRIALVQLSGRVELLVASRRTHWLGARRSVTAMRRARGVQQRCGWGVRS